MRSFAITAWASLICIFQLVSGVNFLKNWKLPNSTLLISILGTAMGLLLVFRVNTAYDRFWEGRKTWTNVHYGVRNLGRLIWTYCDPKTEEEAYRRICAMNLLIAFASSIKHALRDEPGIYTDLGPYLVHIREFAPGSISSRTTLPIPIEISYHLQAYINLFPGTHVLMTNACNALTDCLSSFQRIRQTPIPFAYRIHLKQILFIYLICLPFQLVSSPLGWFTIPVVFLTSFMLLGIETIGGEIENPFGYDLNDLPQDDYVNDIRDEILAIMATDSRRDVRGWIEPLPLTQMRVSKRNLQEMTPANAESRSLESDDSERKKWLKGVQDALSDFIGSMRR
ncbi:Bestrophin, RFP-TM, chloride channel-domain-containing protein [Obelidium mucronatum]|nr:Bestrophin, RFP-TM, chloride channel-domain-containing protein [Obelidium mucronatum]